MENDQKTEKKNGPPPIARADDFRHVYSNSVRLGLTPWDIRFTFGTVEEVQPGEARNVEKITIIMSPQHAMAMLELLKANIEKWVKQQEMSTPQPPESDEEEEHS